ELAEKIAQFRQSRGRATPRARKIPTPFTLALAGRVEPALLWKNLILLGRYASLRLLLILLPMVIIVGLVVSESGTHAELMETLAIFCVVFAAMTTLMGPMVIRNDLRQDLAHLALLKAWPVRGAAIVRGEVLAPLVVLTVLAWLFMVGATALS